MVKQRKLDARTGISGQSRWQFGVVIGVLVLVVAILALKQTTPAVTEPEDKGPQVEVAAPVLETELEASDDGALSLAPAADELPQAHLERMLAEGQPIFAFFHSNTCYQCTEMTRIVGEVYPEFEGKVALVKVNVYDAQNHSLLQQAGIRVIPTLIFVDRSGAAQGVTGILPADQLKAALTEISTEGAP